MKNIIITGATSGIGESTARLLASKGYHLLLTGRNESKLTELKTELGENVRIAKMDVRDYKAVKEIIDNAHKEMGSVDVLINNAGLGFFDFVADGKIEEWHEMFETNVKGLLNCLHAALPHLLESHGHVINLGSVASHSVFPKSGVYCATKHAVLAISDSLRLELADKIRVTTISPGAVATAFPDQTTNPVLKAEYQPYFASALPPKIIAENIAWAIECPENVVISEIIVRPSRKVTQ
jgi:NADP-dependent 3-hydroxy acid dehydrogenase YdfG